MHWNLNDISTLEGSEGKNSSGGLIYLFRIESVTLGGLCEIFDSATLVRIIGDIGEAHLPECINFGQE